MQKSKAERQAAVLRLVDRRTIRRQEELRELLKRAGFDVTQATLSRDFRELNIVKTAEDGGLRYRRLDYPGAPPSVRAQASGNLLVLHTGPGMAAPLAYRIDAVNLPSILGTVAGEDTVLAVVAEGFDARRVQRELMEIIEGG